MLIEFVFQALVIGAQLHEFLLETVILFKKPIHLGNRFSLASYGLMEAANLELLISRVELFLQLIEPILDTLE
jgi:hypothetical protein